MDAFWTILAGSLTASACAILGCYLILRKMAMVGDAISHSVLPGILFAYLLSRARDPLPMFIGAAAFGVFSTFLIEFFHRVGGVQADAAIGITFTSLFALGVILITVFAGQVDLDQECVLYGEIAYVPLDVWITEGGTNLGPRTVWIMGGVLLFVLLFLFLFLLWHLLCLHLLFLVICEICEIPRKIISSRSFPLNP